MNYELPIFGADLPEAKDKCEFCKRMNWDEGSWTDDAYVYYCQTENCEGEQRFFRR